jgi:hypothetical protein
MPIDPGCRPDRRLRRGGNPAAMIASGMDGAAGFQIRIE